MTTKLKIDLAQGILEVEGSETFVKTIYRDFKAQFLGEEAVEEEVKPTSTRRKRSRKSTRSKTKAKPAAESTKTTEPAPPPEPAPAPEKLSTPTYTYVEDLELSATNDHISLVEFMDSKLPITNEERNLVFLYYLQYIIKRKPIKLNDVYTCYKNGNIRAPLNIEQSLKMTADHANWIKITKAGNMSVTPEGKRYVENQLPKKIKN